MNRIRARLKNTSQSWIASIILVLNLVKLAGAALLCLGFIAWTKLGTYLWMRFFQKLYLLKYKNHLDSEFKTVLIKIRY